MVTNNSKSDLPLAGPDNCIFPKKLRRGGLCMEMYNRKCRDGPACLPESELPALTGSIPPRLLAVLHLQMLDTLTRSEK